MRAVITRLTPLRDVLGEDERREIELALQQEPGMAESLTRW